MFTLLLTLLLLDGLLLTVVVLLQAGKGGGLASMGGGMGTDTLIGGRQAATILTKATWATGAIFLVLSFTLAIMSSRAQRPSSILREEFRPTPAAPAPAPVQLPGAAPQNQAPQQGTGQQPAATPQQAPAPTTNQ